MNKGENLDNTYVKQKIAVGKKGDKKTHLPNLLRIPTLLRHSDDTEVQYAKKIR